MRKLLTGVAGCAALVLIAFGWLGYFGGDPFTTLKPEGYRPRPGAPVAVMFSGDIGFRLGIGRMVAERLVAEGIPVVGVNSLTFFRTTRTPADAAALIEAALRRARTIDRAAPIILVGQSFGADMLHVGLARLPLDERQGIKLTALIVPGATVAYRASPGETLTFLMREADALPTARRLDWVPLLCIRGADEEGSLCPLLHQANLRAVALPGGHQLHWDVGAINRVLIAAIAKAGVSLHG